MNIFYAFGSKPNQGLDQSNIWHSNIYMSLIDLGHNIIEFDFNLEPHYAHADPSIQNNIIFNNKNRSILENELIRQIEVAHKKKPLDLFFSYFYSSFVSASIIKKISSMGIPTMNWYCNAAHQFHLVRDIAKAYDFSLVPEKFRINDYKNAGANPIYCQEAANPMIYRPFNLRKIYDVSFVGGAGANRPLYVKELLNSGINVKTWGIGWRNLSPPPNYYKQLKWRIKRSIAYLRRDALLPIIPRNNCDMPLSDSEMIRLFSQSKISLGFTMTNNSTNNSDLKQVRLREFEATMSGAFYMLEYVKDIEDYFDIDKEIVCFHDVNDLIDKVNYYLKHPEERECIRQAGYKRAIKDHTWQIRLTAAFNEAKLL